MQIQEYLKQYKQICPDLTDEEIKFISDSISIVEYKKKEICLETGKIQKEIVFILKGLARLYYINDIGQEINVWFAKENEYATDYISFINQKPSTSTIEFLEPSTVIKISFDNIEKGYEQFKNIERYGRIIVQMAFTAQQNRMDSFLFKTAEERYLDFLETNNDLFHRISLTHLASYLGMERQTLSRVRNAIIKK